MTKMTKLRWKNPFCGDFKKFLQARIWLLLQFCSLILILEVILYQMAISKFHLRALCCHNVLTKYGKNLPKITIFDNVNLALIARTATWSSPLSVIWSCTQCTRYAPFPQSESNSDITKNGYRTHLKFSDRCCYRYHLCSVETVPQTTITFS